MNAISMNFIKELEKITGHVFKDASLLQCALTHSSAQGLRKNNYERLEFLGDRILGLIVSEMLFHLFPDALEGELSVRFNALVNADMCVNIAETINLPAMMNMGVDMRTLKGRRLANIYADAIEALIAVLYLEGGLETARIFIHKYWLEAASRSEAFVRDAKTELQEWAHRQGCAQPIYHMIGRTGPDHDPIFEVELDVVSFVPERGIGTSKRQAQQAAAEKMLYREGVWTKKNT